MKQQLQRFIIAIFLFCASLPAFSQVDVRVVQQGNFVSLDTVYLTIDANDNSGTGANGQTIYFRVYNFSPTHSEELYLEAEWLCSNSSAFYQYCQEYPPDYTTGTCHTFHREGLRKYDDYSYSLPPDTCSYNYLKCHFLIYDYSVEQEHEKICRFRIKRKQTGEVMDVMYLVIRRGNLPCSQSQPGNTTGIHTVSADEVATIYPNPASNVLTVAAKQAPLVSYSLFSPVGALIADQQIENTKSFDIPVGNLANGVYYLRLTDSRRKSFYRKIVVDH